MSETTNTRAANNGHEDAVRAYLLWLEDPESLRDQDAIEAANADVARSKDPIERLKAISRLEALSTVDGQQFRDGFINHAKPWAAANNVSVDAFRELGVSPKDLKDAGFAVTVRGSASSGARRTRVSPDKVRASVPDGPFRIADVESLSGASTATVRKVILQMVADGSVVDLGPDQAHSGRGRAPLMYRRS